MVNTNINLVKFIASIMVIVVHVSAVNFTHLDSSAWDVSNWYNSFSRVCVPLFFMISGALLIRDNTSLKHFFTKRYVRVLIPLFAWSMIYFLYPYLYGVEQKRSMTSMLSSPISVHLWYLYALVGLYLLVPLLSKLYLSSNNHEKILFILIWFVTSSLLPTLNYTTSISVNINLYGLNLIPGYIGFFFLGRYLYDLNVNKSFIFVSFIVYIITSGLTSFLTKEYSLTAGKPITTFYSYLSPIVVISSASIFISLNNIRISSRLLGRVLGYFSSCALGVYCLQSLMINEFFYKTRINGSVEPVWLNIPLTSLSVFLLCIAVCYPLSKIKFLKRIV